MLNFEDEIPDLRRRDHEAAHRELLAARREAVRPLLRWTGRVLVAVSVLAAIVVLLPGWHPAVRALPAAVAAAVGTCVWLGAPSALDRDPSGGDPRRHLVGAVAAALAVLALVLHTVDLLGGWLVLIALVVAAVIWRVAGPAHAAETVVRTG